MPKMKLTNQHRTLITDSVKAYGLNGPDDDSYISINQCSQAKENMLRLKPKLIKHFPKQYTQKLRQSDQWTNFEMITILRQLLKPIDKSILSKKRHFYCKFRKRSKSESFYKIL